MDIPLLEALLNALLRGGASRRKSLAEEKKQSDAHFQELSSKFRKLVIETRIELFPQEEKSFQYRQPSGPTPERRRSLAVDWAYVAGLSRKNDDHFSNRCRLMAEFWADGRDWSKRNSPALQEEPESLESYAFVRGIDVKGPGGSRKATWKELQFWIGDGYRVTTQLCSRPDRF